MFFPSNFVIFLNSASSAATLVFYLPEKTEKGQSLEYLKKNEKNTIFNEQPVQRSPKWLLNIGKNGDQEKGFMIQGVQKVLPHFHNKCAHWYHNFQTKNLDHCSPTYVYTLVLQLRMDSLSSIGHNRNYKNSNSIIKTHEPIIYNYIIDPLLKLCKMLLSRPTLTSLLFNFFNSTESNRGSFKALHTQSFRTNEQI